MKCHCWKSKCLRCQGVQSRCMLCLIWERQLWSPLTWHWVGVSVEGIFGQMSSAGWSRRTAVAAAQRSQAGLGLGYHALFCLQPVCQWTRNCGCLCCCCCGEGGQPHPVLVLSLAWEGCRGEGRPGSQSRVENSWMLPLRPQRMFRAHIRCDQWCNFFVWEEMKCFS